MAHGFSPQSRKSGPYQQGQEGVGYDVLEDYSSWSMNNFRIYPSMMQDLAGTTTVMGERAGTPYRGFDPDVDSEVGFSFPRPRWWINGRVTARVWYTGTDDPGLTIRAGLSILPMSIGDSFVSPTYYGFNLANPEDVLTLDRQPERSNDSSAFPVVRNHHHWITVNFRREGTDATNDDYRFLLELLCLEISYKEFPGQEGLNLASDKRHWSNP